MASKCADELLKDEEDEKRKEEKRKQRNKKVQKHLLNLLQSLYRRKKLESVKR